MPRVLEGYRPPPLGLPQEPRHGPPVGSYRVAVSYERGTPVPLYSNPFPRPQLLAADNARSL